MVLNHLRRQHAVALTLVAALALTAAAFPSAGEAVAEAPVASSSAGVADHVRLGNGDSERSHHLSADGASKATSGTVEQGQRTEEYEARTVSDGGSFEVTLDVEPDLPLTLQFQEVRPNDAWGAEFGFRVYLDGELFYVRDNETADAGGGVYSSFFVDTNAPEVLADGEVTITVEGTNDEVAYFSEVWAYSDLDGMVNGQKMRVADKMIFVLGQDYRTDEFFRERLDYIQANYSATDDVGLGFAVLDYFPVRSPAQMAANYQRYVALSREYDLPFAIESTSDWEGTPTGVADGKGGYFGDLEYQQVLWSPQDQTGPDKDTYTNRGGEVQRLDELLGDAYEPKFGLSVPNVWGSTPWLTWHNPGLNAFYAGKVKESTDEVTPVLWDLQRSDEDWRVLPFSTATESVYWSKKDNVGVWDITYTDHNGGVEREDIRADLNPYTVAAAAEDGVTLELVDGEWPEDAKAWLYKNQSKHQQFFTDQFYYGLPRERITAGPDEAAYPDDMLRHNIHSEIYSRKQEPYYSDVYPSSAQGVVERGRPGAQFISLDDVFSLGGFYHLQRLREFGRIANPNLENSVSTHGPDKTLLLRQAYVNGSRYTSPYNWQLSGDDESTNWIKPFMDDMNPWDVVHDADPDGQISVETSVTQSFTAGELRLANRVAVQIERTGDGAAPLRLTLREGGQQGRVVSMRHLSAAELPDSGWATFDLPIEQLDRDQEYTIEVEQVGGGDAAYEFPTAGGDLLHRVGLNMNAERDRSMTITWRRDASDAISHVADELGDAATIAEQTLAAAKRALDENRYVDAYELAIRADAQRFPVLYQSSGEARMEPFPLTVESEFDIDVDVLAHIAGEEFEFQVKGYESGSVDVSLHQLTDHVVTVDGEPVDTDVSGNNLTFTLDVTDTEPVLVHVSRENG